MYQLVDSSRLGASFDSNQTVEHLSAIIGVAKTLQPAMQSHMPARRGDTSPLVQLKDASHVGGLAAKCFDGLHELLAGGIGLVAAAADGLCIGVQVLLHGHEIHRQPLFHGDLHGGVETVRKLGSCSA